MSPRNINAKNENGGSKIENRYLREWFADIRAGVAVAPSAVMAFQRYKNWKTEADSVGYLEEQLNDNRKYGEFRIYYVAIYALGRLGVHAKHALPRLMAIAREDMEYGPYAYEACLLIDPKGCGADFWRSGLASKEDIVVQFSAKALEIIGNGSKGILRDLAVATLSNVRNGFPRNWSECLSALMKLDADRKEIIRMARSSFRKKHHCFIGIGALKDINTDEARAVLASVFKYIQKRTLDCQRRSKIRPRGGAKQGHLAA